MEIKNYNCYEDVAEIEVNIQNHITIGLTKLESFLEMVSSAHGSSTDKIANELNKRFESKRYEIKVEMGQFNLLQDYPNLILNAIGALMSPIISNNVKNARKTTTDVKALLRSRLYFYYQMVKSLTVSMSEDQAIGFFQKFIDQDTKNQRDPSQFVDKLSAVEESAKQLFEMYKSHDLITFKVNEGVAGYKISKCKWYEVMKDLEDPKFCYAVCCHYDFEAAKNMNPKFTLTREKTLMEGKNYCDFCYHDTRIINNIEHPPVSFWEELSQQ